MSLFHLGPRGRFPPRKPGSCSGLSQPQLSDHSSCRDGMQEGFLGMAAGVTFLLSLKVLSEAELGVCIFPETAGFRMSSKLPWDGLIYLFLYFYELVRRRGGPSRLWELSSLQMADLLCG